MMVGNINTFESFKFERQTNFFKFVEYYLVHMQTFIMQSIVFTYRILSYHTTEP